MITRTIFGLVVICFFILTLTPDSFAVSEASALFLRIASGARAAGMGEAFVAVADDATATHWNPAGLGAYPLADSWKDANVPMMYRPLKQVAVLKNENGSGYQAYEFWAISQKGLVRYDNSNWYEGDVFSLRSNDKVAPKVKSFFNIENDEILAAAVAKVAEFNSQMTFEELESLRTEVMSNVPDDYTRKTEMSEAFDSLIIVYNECRIDWVRANEIAERFKDGMKDSTLKESECEKINFAVQRSKSRFVPEEITIPFSAMFEGEFTSIASGGRNLMVGTTEGLYYYSGERWRTLNDLEGLPSTSITCLQVIAGTYYIGTDKGLTTYKLGRFEGFSDNQFQARTDSIINELTGNYETPVTDESVEIGDLPKGYVSAIGSGNASDIWAVIDNDLYRFDGETWSNSFIYSVAIDETPESIAEKFLIYGSENEKEKFIEKLFAINEPQNDDNSMGTPAEDAIPIEEVLTNDPEAEIPVDIQIDTTQLAENQIIPLEEEETVFVQGDLNSLNPGDMIKVPYLVGIRGVVTSIYAVDNNIWLGTDNGLIYFNGESWSLPGYKEYVVAPNVTFDTLLVGYYKMKHDSSLTENYKRALLAVNDLNEPVLNTGDTIKIYKNPTA
ncbi:MAG: hypothetical protein ABIJ12_13895, partial [bacterium]